MNDSHPRRTLLGTLSTPARALVDGRGRVATAPGWALDWWVGADDRWHRPQAEASVRQHLLGNAPVVETAMHIPGGDAVHRAYAMRDRGSDGAGRDLLVVEIENQSAVPFALALVVQPYDAYRSPPAAGGSIERLALHGTVLLVDGRPGLVVAKGPARAASVSDSGRLESLVVNGQAVDELTPVWSPEAQAGAALIYPLPHTAVLRVVLPLDSASSRAEPTRRRAGRRRAGRRRADRTRAATSAAAPESSPELYPVAVPTGEQVAKGWEVQTRRPMTVSIPDVRWTAVTEASRAFALLGVPPARTWAETATMVGALDRWGFADEADQSLEGIGDPAVDPRPVDAAALVALADHWQLTRRPELVERSASAIAAGLRRADRPRRRGHRADPSDPSDAAQVATDLAWRLRGFEAAAILLDASGQPEAAAEVRRRLQRLDVPAADPTGGPLADLTGGPLAHPDLVGALSPAATLLAAAADLAGGTSGRALDRLARALATVSPTLVWPEAIDPARPDLAVGRGHDLVAGAAWLICVRNLLVVESPAPGPPELALCSVLPESWRGQSFEIHGAPTAYGTLSYAVRWHGARPALLWELEPHPALATTPVRLRAPGLDVSWSTQDLRGDVLLAGPSTVGSGLGASPEPGGSFS